MAEDPQDTETELDTDADDTAEATSTDSTDEPTPTTKADDEADEAKKADKAAAAKTTPVARKKVVSKRVTPKGGGRPTASTATNRTVKKKTDDDDEEISFSSGRYTPPSNAPGAQLPSPWWVPALMFGLLILGALVIMLNYMGVFGDAENYRLIIGLVLILGGIITATQYR